MPDETISVQESNGRGRYILKLSGAAEADMTFTRQGPDHMLITYTSVPLAYEGQGIGRRLVERAVQDARAGGYTITPVCGYVATQFRRHKDWQDVLHRGTS